MCWRCADCATAFAMTLPRRAKCTATPMGAMRREIEPFKRSLAQGRKYPVDESRNIYKSNREDSMLLRPVREQLGLGSDKDRRSSKDDQVEKSEESSVNWNAGTYMERQDLEDVMREHMEKDTPDFLRPIDDVLERTSNKDYVYKVSRDNRPTRERSDFVDYSSLLARHRRQEENDRIRAEIASYQKPLVMKRRREPVEQIPSFLELRMRHDGLSQKPKTSRTRKSDNGKFMEVDPDDDLMIPCSFDLLRYGQKDEERLRRRCDLKNLSSIERYTSPSPPPPPKYGSGQIEYMVDEMDSIKLADTRLLRHEKAEYPKPREMRAMLAEEI